MIGRLDPLLAKKSRHRAAPQRFSSSLADLRSPSIIWHSLIGHNEQSRSLRSG